MNGLVVFPTFNLSLNLAIRSSLSVPRSAPGLVFADCIELLHLRAMQIKLTMRYHLTCVRIAIIKSLQIINAGEGTENREPSTLLVEI